MAITPPAFQKDAVPSLKGWHHPKTNELLKSTRHTQAQIDEFNGITAVESPIAIEIAEVVEDVVEDLLVDGLLIVYEDSKPHNLMVVGY